MPTKSTIAMQYGITLSAARQAIKGRKYYAFVNNPPGQYEALIMGHNLFTTRKGMESALSNFISKQPTSNSFQVITFRDHEVPNELPFLYKTEQTVQGTRKIT